MEDDLIIEAGAPLDDADAVLVVKGEIDVHTASALEEAVRQTFTSGGRRVALDFGDVSFIDSSGLRSLIALQQEAQGGGGTLRLSRASRPVRRLLEVTALLDFFPIDEG
jgi:anti-sigma B factor antagonist